MLNRVFMLQIDQGDVQVPVEEGVVIGHLAQIIRRAVSPYVIEFRELSKEDIANVHEFQKAQLDKEKEQFAIKQIQAGDVTQFEVWLGETLVGTLNSEQDALTFIEAEKKKNYQ